MKTTAQLEAILEKLIIVVSISFGLFILFMVLYVFWISKEISENIETPIDRLIYIFKEMHLDPSQAKELFSLTLNANQPLSSIQEINCLF